jgi:C4-dicarboxylate-specific signal transduction histidine kinase
LAGWGWLRWSIARPNGDYRVRGDERQLTQALLNLVLNAEEALESPPAVGCNSALTATPGRVRIAVSDNGSRVDPRCGIASSSRSSRPASPNAGSAWACP